MRKENIVIQQLDVVPFYESKAKKTKKNKKKGDSKTRKTTPKKAKKTIRRVKGHFT